jgi:hypothetical protein
MAYRPEFIEAFLLIADAVEELFARGMSRPVLVGGAAVELWTGSALVSGDFDFVTEHQAEFEEALLRRGFGRPHGVGQLMRGVIHPTLHIGVEVVSGPLFGGLVPDNKLALIPYEGKSLAVISVEDAIADRICQYASHEPSHQEMLEQAKVMLRIAKIGDPDYLDRRIRQETDDRYDLDFLRKQIGENASNPPHGA